MATQRIVLIGLGNMGLPMAKNLLKAGFEVTVYNRTAAKATPLQEAGAALAGSPGELWEKADTVITMVADDAALRQVHEGENGLLAGAAAGKTVIDMSTVSPATSKELADPMAGNGEDHLD